MTTKPEESKPTKSDDRVRSEFDKWCGFSITSHSDAPKAAALQKAYWNAWQAAWLARGKQEEWVSVDERLPHTHTVLGFIHDYPRGSESFVDTVCFFPAHDPRRIVESFGSHPDEWRLNGYDDRPDRGVVKVTHWRELPAHPTETGKP